jgi:RHH-type proline utilization regulon transcriptional repressor/proline dehydrogenase/delta 1-pyrroline-5-carboxylate dehydrogenase
MSQANATLMTMDQPEPWAFAVSRAYAPDDEALVRAASVRGPASTQGRSGRGKRGSTSVASTATSRRSARPSVGLGGVEDFLREYGLSTREGLAHDGAGRGAVARAGCEDRRQADRGQARRRAFRRERARPLRHLACLRLLLGAGRHLAADSSGREAATPSSPRWSSAWACRRCVPPPVKAMRVLGHQFVLGETIKAALSTRALARSQGLPLFLRHARRGRPHREGRRALFPAPMPTPSRPSVAAGKTGPAGSARHFGEALRAASALRGGQRRTRPR